MEYRQKNGSCSTRGYDAMKSDNVITACKTDLKETDKMHAILEDPKLLQDQKINLYNEEWQKAIDNRQKVEHEFMIEVNKSDTDFPHNDQVEKEIIESLPKSLKVKGKLLLERLKENIVNWNPVSELIVSTTKYDG